MHINFGQKINFENLGDVKIWITSDPHIGHTNILKFMPETRPFADTDEMNSYIIEDWNSKVSDEDYVIILGDVFFTTKEEMKEVWAKLKGRKVLVYGNHDKTLRQFVEGYDYLEFYYNGRFIVLSHYPLARWNKQLYNSYHLHGHEHGRYSPEGRCIDVGWDVFGGLITLDEAMHYAKKKALSEKSGE